jgi:hypothetical protein
VTVGLKNPRAIEAAVNLAAMFVHFQTLAPFIINLTNKEIEGLKNSGERTISHGPRRGERTLAGQKESVLIEVN